MDALHNSKYDSLSPIIEDLYVKHVRLDEERTRVLNEIFREVIVPFVEKMKENDSTFKKVFNRIFYTGSFYDGLKIDEATEFDLNLVLNDLTRELGLKLVKRRRPAGFVAIEVLSLEARHTKPYSDWLYKIGQSYFLNPNALHSWLQGIVTRTLNEIEKKDGGVFPGYQIKLRQSGPAWTLSVTPNQSPGTTIDIDLVVALEFPSLMRPMVVPSISKRKNKNDIRHESNKETWFAVPKPPSKNCSGKFCIVWRVSFPIQETAIIRDLEYFKYTLKLIKKVRDELKIHEVASYYIKTLFLWELQKNGKQIWVVHGRGRLFVHMLKRFAKALENGRIPFFWDINHNLVGNASKQSLSSSAERLNNLLLDIDKLSSDKDLRGLRNLINSLLSSHSD